MTRGNRARIPVNREIQTARTQVRPRVTQRAMVPTLAILGTLLGSPAAAEQVTFVCNVRYEDGNIDHTTVEIDTSIPTIDGKKDGEVEDFGGPCTYTVSVTANLFSWARDCRTADGEKKRSDSFKIDRLTGFYSELSSVGGESHLYRASGTCEKRRNTKPLD